MARHLRRLTASTARTAAAVLAVLCAFGLQTACPAHADDGPEDGPAPLDDKNNPKIELENWAMMASFGRLASTNGDLQNLDPVCISSRTGRYVLTMVGTVGADGQFALWGGGFAHLRFHVHFAPDGSLFQEMEHGVTLPFRTDVDNCRKYAGDNAAFRITIRAEDFNAADSGIYGGTLTALLGAE